MTNSNDALRACPFCGEKLSHNSGKINRVARCDTSDCWMTDRKMTVPLDDPHQVEQWNRRTSPVAGGDLRESVSELIEILSAGNVEEGCRIFDHTPEEIGLHVMENHTEILAALNQPAAPVEAVEAYTITPATYEAAVKGRQDFRRAFKEMRDMLGAKEWAVVEAIGTEQELSSAAVLRQAVRLYQLHHDRLKTGETCKWSGDEQRQKDFAGPLYAHPPEPAASTVAQGEG